MIGVYFSGTGNTKYCVEQFLQAMNREAKAFSIEDINVVDEIKQSDRIVLGYPVYFSNLPKILRDFLDKNQGIFKGKKIFIIATMGLFSGDGTGVSARLFRNYGAEVIGGLHLKMPDCIGDEKVLKKTLEENRLMVKKAEIKIAKAVEQVKRNTAPQEGLNGMYHIAGLFGQRLWFYNKTKSYYTKLKIDTKKCVGCGICVKKCPMNNLVIHEYTATQKGLCTMCYRCVSYCPQKAIKLLGKHLYEQCKIENYI